MNSFSNLSYANTGGIKNKADVTNLMNSFFFEVTAFLKNVQIAFKYKRLNILMIVNFVVHCVLESLLMEYELLKVSYTALKRKMEYRRVDFRRCTEIRQIEL